MDIMVASPGRTFTFPDLAQAILASQMQVYGRAIVESLAQARRTFRPSFSVTYLMKGLDISMVVSKSMSDGLLAKVLAIAIFVGAALSAGFGQSVNNSAASSYKTNCASCHGPDGRGGAVGESFHAAEFPLGQGAQ